MPAQPSTALRRAARRDAFLAKVAARPTLMGILNVTPDSFSDGGRFETVEAALARARALVAEGADIIDVGGESTRPGFTPVDAAEELARVVPVLAAIEAHLDAPVSVDTTKAIVARAALDAGAVLVNDVWGLQGDSAMADTVAEAEAALVAMHNRSETDEDLDIVADIARFFERSLDLADRAGIPRARILLDPGIGFGKSARQNVEAIAALPRFLEYGLPILVGLSRKSFLGSLLDVGVHGRLIGTIAANLAAATGGARVFRVHDAAEHAAAFRVFETIRGSGATARP